MKNKKRALLAVGCLVPIIGVTETATPASAWLSTCSVNYQNFALDVVGAHCTTHGGPGGLNQVQVIGHCAAANGASVYPSGPWVGINTTSYLNCNNFPPYLILVSGSYYETR